MNLICPICNIPLQLTPGWIPSYSDPDNSGMQREAEPFCPKCESGVISSDDLASMNH